MRLVQVVVVLGVVQLARVVVLVVVGGGAAAKPGKAECTSACSVSSFRTFALTLYAGFCCCSYRIANFSHLLLLLLLQSGLQTPVLNPVLCAPLPLIPDP